MASRKEPPACDDALKWLRANGHDLAPLTGQDARALRAIAHLLQLYSVADGAGARAAIAALGATVTAMQPKCRPLAKALIPWALDWSDEDRLWPRIIGAAESELRR